ncbi:hypothetical protein RJT34_13467 [Clitoria ternatea]|uniref:K-box domain-containing protein n=1 Tax=Clitoria ternatea TaxID=43366 RepID=A0AAN9JNM8_CLITE
MQQILERRNRHSAIHGLDNPSTEQQVESDSYDMVRKEVEDKTRELSRLNGQDLQGLTIQELHKLEELLQRRRSAILKIKDEKIIQDITHLKKKEVELVKENQKLKQVQGIVQKQRRSNNSIITCSSSNPPPAYGSFDTFLKLGLVYNSCLYLNKTKMFSEDYIVRSECFHFCLSQ